MLQMKSLNFFANDRNRHCQNQNGIFFKIRGSVISKRNLEMILSSELPLSPSEKNFISCRFRLGDNAEKPLFSHVNFYCGNVQLMKRKPRIPQGVTGFPRVLKVPKGVLIFNLVGWF